jgi:hypothetical protein
MKSFLILAVLSLIPGVGFTQGAALESEVDSELEQLYTTSAPAARKTVVQAQPAAGAQTQPIYILNQATPTAQANAQNSNTVQTQQIHKQPTTFVEASPMVESRADQMKKSRVDAEGQTETKIVEKLEQSRLDDEKRRADVLFGNKFDQLSNKHDEAAPAVIQPVHPAQPTIIQVPVQTIAPPPVEQKDVLTREAIREELQSALKIEQEVPTTAVESRYFSALLGMPDHPDSSNIRGNYSLGGIFGTKYDDTYAVEGAFVFSNYTMNPIYYNGYVAPDMDVNQYSGSIGIKYFMFSGMVKPFVGGLGQYTYRTFQWANTGYANYYSNSSSETSTNSHAIDLGLNVGADVTFNSKFTVGFDYRYFFNLSSRRNQSAFAYQPYYGTALEQLNSTLVSVTAKVQF